MSSDFLIAQLSDLHIRPPGELYQGVTDSSAHLADAIEHLGTLDRRPDIVMISGDMVDKGEPSEYEQLVSLLDTIDQPVFVIPGNHDERENFRKAFHRHEYMPMAGPVSYSIEQFPVRLVALDSTVTGDHHGLIDPSQAEWLRKTLAHDLEKPTVVMMHHPPFMSGIPYMDIYRCHGEDALGQVIGNSPNVALVVCGHLHRVMMQRWNHTMICSCPSTTTEISLQLDTNARPASRVGPRGYLLHHWTPAQGLMTHVVNLGPSDGPHPFA